MSNKSQPLLVVEDDPNMGLLLEENLQMAGYETVLVKNGIEAVNRFKELDCALCLLDIMLPGKDGFEVAKEIKKINPATPFIFLTARAMSRDKIEGFEIGCDDFITKPFELELLLHRIKAVLRRSSAIEDDSQNVIEFGLFELHKEERLLKNSEDDFHLTAIESNLIWLFATNLNEVVQRKNILQNVWGNDSYFTSNSLDVYLTKVRKLLRADPRLSLKNIYGHGYKLEILE